MLVSATTDLEADALYLQLRKGKVVRTEELDDWTLVDVDAHGQPLGIEVIHPNRVWPLQRFIERYNVPRELGELLEQFLPIRAHRTLIGQMRTNRPLTAGNTTKVLAVAL
ncbi:DUF2283 domain-containing protein [Micromonospora aurantiaca (nom. illeg.)]|uniref:DUF2283 domain-containing protein n=1 Tax=Micromonospora aurantiaca (nom. illeg.) TaxID=47850 RepID=UPI0037A524D8